MPGVGPQVQGHLNVHSTLVPGTQISDVFVGITDHCFRRSKRYLSSDQKSWRGLETKIDYLEFLIDCEKCRN